jgi:hypothetical protein
MTDLEKVAELDKDAVSQLYRHGRVSAIAPMR